MDNTIFYRTHIQQQLSTDKKFVFFVESNDDNFPHAKKAINKIMEDMFEVEIWSKGIYKIKSKNSLSHTSHPYFEFDYDEENDHYVYTFVRP